MNNYSPMKNKLLEFQITPAKVIVDNQINGWLQTQAKNSLLKKPKLQRQLRPKLPTLSPCTKRDMTSLEILKQRKTILLKSTTKQLSQKQLPPTASSLLHNSQQFEIRTKFGSQIRIQSLSSVPNEYNRQVVHVSEFQSPKQQQLAKSSFELLECLNLNINPKQSQGQKFTMVKLRSIQSRLNRSKNSKQNKKSQRDGKNPKEQLPNFSIRRLIGAKIRVF